MFAAEDQEMTDRIARAEAGLRENEAITEAWSEFDSSWNWGDLDVIAEESVDGYLSYLEADLTEDLAFSAGLGTNVDVITCHHAPNNVLSFRERRKHKQEQQTHSTFPERFYQFKFHPFFIYIPA